MRTRFGRWWTLLAAVGLLAVPGSPAMAQDPAPDRDEIVQPDDSEDAGLAWSEDDAEGPADERLGGEAGGAAMRFRHGPRGRPGLGFGRPGQRLGGLDLTETQRKRLADIRDRQMRSGIQARADLRIAQLDLGKLLRADAPDKRAIDVQIDRIGTMRSSLQKSRVAAMLEARSVLTVEQRRQLRERRMHDGKAGPRGTNRDGGSD